MLTGFLCTTAVNTAGTDGFFSLPGLKATADRLTAEAAKRG